VVRPAGETSATTTGLGRVCETATVTIQAQAGALPDGILIPFVRHPRAPLATWSWRARMDAVGFRRERDGALLGW
jgi:hypothetical protein